MWASPLLDSAGINPCTTEQSAIGNVVQGFSPAGKFTVFPLNVDSLCNYGVKVTENLLFREKACGWRLR